MLSINITGLFPIGASAKVCRLMCDPFQWRHYGTDGVSNHRRYDCLLNRVFRRRSRKISKLRATGLCTWNSLVTGEFPAQKASYADNVSIWWRHHALISTGLSLYTLSNCFAISHRPRYLVSLALMPCSLQNFKTIWQSRDTLWVKEISRSLRCI